jgi:hypothetical protein
MLTARQRPKQAWTGQLHSSRQPNDSHRRTGWDPITTSQAQGKIVYGRFPSVFRPPGQHWAAVQISLLQEGANAPTTGFNDGFTPQSIYDRVVMPKDGHELILLGLINKCTSLTLRCRQLAISHSDQSLVSRGDANALVPQERITPYTTIST